MHCVVQHSEGDLKYSLSWLKAVSWVLILEPDFDHKKLNTLVSLTWCESTCAFRISARFDLSSDLFPHLSLNDSFNDQDLRLDTGAKCCCHVVHDESNQAISIVSEWGVFGIKQVEGFKVTCMGEILRGDELGSKLTSCSFCPFS